MGNKDDYVDLGLSCGDVCKALDRGLKETQSVELGESVAEAIDRMRT